MNSGKDEPTKTDIMIKHSTSQISTCSQETEIIEETDDEYSLIKANAAPPLPEPASLQPQDIKPDWTYINATDIMDLSGYCSLAELNAAIMLILEARTDFVVYQKEEDDMPYIYMSQAGFRKFVLMCPNSTLRQYRRSITDQDNYKWHVFAKNAVSMNYMENKYQDTLSVVNNIKRVYGSVASLYEDEVDCQNEIVNQYAKRVKIAAEDAADMTPELADKFLHFVESMPTPAMPPSIDTVVAACLKGVFPVVSSNQDDDE